MSSQEGIKFVLDVIGALPGWAIFLATITALAIIGLAVGAAFFIKAYTQQRGTLQAQADSLKQVVKDLEVTTKAVKAIESDIEFRSWHAKEENSVRREKLEDLLKAALAHYGWAKTYGTTAQFSIEDLKESEFEPVLDTCVELYFPELRKAARSFTMAVDTVTLKAMEIRSARIARFQALPGEEQLKWYPDWNSRCTPTEEEKNQFVGTIKHALETLGTLKDACGELMKTLRPEATEASTR